MMPILVKSDDVRSGRPGLVTACTRVNGFMQNYKTQKQYNMNSCLKGCSNCIDTLDIEFVWLWAVYTVFIFSQS